MSATCAGDTIVIVDPQEALIAALTGRVIERVVRHGKWMWLELDRPPYVLFHLGMSGAWHVRGEATLEYRTGGKRREEPWPPRFTKVHMVLDDGGELAMTDARRLGRVHLRHEVYSEPPIAELGFDPLKSMPTLKEFRALLARRRGAIKALLLDQSFSAGIGNWVADEVLYQAAIDPRAEIAKLTSEDIRRLHAKIRSVAKTAVDKDAESDRFPKSWLFHHRWEKGTRTAAGEAVEHIVVAGRTTAWVPSRQRAKTRSRKPATRR